MIRTKTNLAALAAILGALLAGCGGGGGGGEDPGPTAELMWTFTGLEALGPDFEYEGWLIVDGAPVSTGRFTVDAGGVPSESGTTVPQEEADLATAFVLTIEPKVDPDPGPAPTKILGGEILAGEADLAVNHPAALGDDFTAATGEFILATPSSSASDDDSRGIWWFDPASGQATLNFPPLPAGWAYEGWIVDGNGPISTGRFFAPAGPDSDLAGPNAGPDSDGPPFPGQDFIDPPLDLVGLTAVISVEPEPDDSPAPFTLKPLVASPIDSDTAPTLQGMMNNAHATNPTGQVTITTAIR